MYLYTLKEFIDYYKSRRTTVYVTFLDASKAFDRIDHWLLFNKMIKKGVPLFIIKLLFFGTHVRECLYAGVIHVPPVCVLPNGVKRGGIISPMLFNLYMEDLSLKLNCFLVLGDTHELLSLIIYVTPMIFVLLICLPVACNICLIFVKSMHSHISYYIVDQSPLHCASRKTQLKSVLHHFI